MTYFLRKSDIAVETPFPTANFEDLKEPQLICEYVNLQKIVKTKSLQCENF